MDIVKLLPKVFLIIIFPFVLFGLLPSVITDWWWFDNVGYISVFSKTLKTQLVSFLLSFFICFAIFAINFFTAIILTGGKVRLSIKNIHEPNVALQFIGLAIATFLSVMISLLTWHNWDIILRYFEASLFNEQDPIFAKDIGFYFFHLPFYKFIKHISFFILCANIAMVITTYFLRGVIQWFKEWDKAYMHPIKIHIGLLIILIGSNIAAGFMLESL